MKLQLIIEILVLCALVAFATARVIDSRSFDDGSDFTPRLISNVTKNNNKHRQNEIVVSASDYDDPVGSHEISVGEEDVVASQSQNQNNIVSNDIPAASGVVTSSNEDNNVALLADENTEVPVNIDDAHPLNRYCTCNEAECNCCREFKLPLVSVRGPGCASLRYLGKNRMSIAIKYGDITLTSRTISGRKARPVCLNLPGGFSQFCGRIYGINRESDDFQACLGLELRAEEEVEAALRVSCFKFGPKGLKMTDAQPLPPVVEAADEDEEEGGGLLGLVTGAGDSDEDYDEDEEEEDEEAEGQDVGSSTTGDEDTDLLGFADDDEDDEDDDESDEEADELDDDDEDDDGAAPPDYPTGFSLLDGIFGDSSNKKKKPVQTRNKVNTVAEDVKVNQVGAKVKIPNSPAILSSASISQNEIDTTIPKDSAANAIKLDPVDLAPAAAVETVVAEVVAPAVATIAEEKPKPVESSVISELQSNAGIPLVSTTPKPKKKPATSLLDTLESLISGGDDDDDDDDEDEDDDATKDDETEDDDEEEEVDDEDEEKDDEEEKDEDEEKDEEKDDEEEKDEDEEKDEEDEEEDEPEDDDDEDEKDDETSDAEESTNDKETLTTKGEEKDTKKTKKKGTFSGFFARLMKFI